MPARELRHEAQNSSGPTLGDLHSATSKLERLVHLSDRAARVVATAVADRRNCTPELRIAYTIYQALADEHQRSLGVFESFRKAAESWEQLGREGAVDRPSGLIEAALTSAALMEAAANHSLEGQGIAVVVGAILAIETDESGAACGEFLNDVCGIHRETRSKGHLPLALLQVAERQADRGFESFGGKPRRYLARAIENEAKQIGRHERRDRDQKGHQRAMPAEPGFLETIASPAMSQLDRLLISKETENLQRIVVRVASRAPKEQAALLAALLGGQSYSEARRALDLPQSTENALRNRLRRAVR